MTQRAASNAQPWHTPEEVDRWLGQLAQAAQAGDRMARDMLWEAVGPRLTRLARWQARYLTQSEREDIAQETYLLFLGLVGGWERSEPEGAGFARYLFGMFRWRVRNAIRAGMRGGTRLLHGETWERPAQMLGTSWPEQTIDLAAFLASLTPHEQQIVHLRAVEGLTMRQIAARIGVAPRTVSRVWNRILHRLRASMDS